MRSSRAKKNAAGKTKSDETRTTARNDSNSANGSSFAAATKIGNPGG